MVQNLSQTVSYLLSLANHHRFQAIFLFELSPDAEFDISAGAYRVRSLKFSVVIRMVPWQSGVEYFLKGSLDRGPVDSDFMLGITHADKVGCLHSPSNPTC